MILSHNELMELVYSGVITGAKVGNVNAASIDVRLGGEFLSERASTSSRLHTLDLAKRDPLKYTKHTLSDGSKMFLDPGEFTLAHTVELFNLPPDISAEFVLKSSMARCGLNQLTAVWCDAGWTNSRLTLELSNVTQHHRLLLTVGMEIGQMVFHRHAPVPAHALYSTVGRYNNASSVETAKESA